MMENLDDSVPRGPGSDRTKADVLFVVPPYGRFLGINSHFFPMGLGYIAACLKRMDIRTIIYNADYHESNDGSGALVLRVLRRILRKKLTWARYSQIFLRYFKYVKNVNHPIWREFNRVLTSINPRVVGISSKNVDLPSVFMMARIVKKYDPAIAVIVGGPSASTCEKELVACNDIDFLVIGEGETTAPELIRAVLDGSGVRTIKGIVYRDHGEPIRTERQELIADLSMLPFPDRDCMVGVNRKGALVPIREVSDILTTRGCPYPCKFCACYEVWGTRVPRSRRVEEVVGELEFLIEKYGQRKFIFWDDLFAVSRKRVFELCSLMIEKKLNITWVCFLRINNIEADLLDILKRAGCVEVQTGIESGNDRVLAHIGKGFTIEQVREKSRIVKESGLRWLAFFIVGFPTETEVEINDTMRLVDEIKPDSICVSVFAPYRGTEFHRVLAANGSVGSDYLMADTFNVHSNFTGTIPDVRFRDICLRAIRFGEVYSADNSVMWESRTGGRRA